MPRNSKNGMNVKFYTVPWTVEVHRVKNTSLPTPEVQTLKRNVKRTQIGIPNTVLEKNRANTVVKITLYQMTNVGHWIRTNQNVLNG